MSDPKGLIVPADPAAVQRGGAKLGVLLAEGPGTEGFREAVALCGAAIERGDEVYLYCLHEGTGSVREAEVQALRARGLRLFGCAYGARRRGIPLDESAIFSGLGILADIIATVDRFAAVTRAAQGAAGGKGRAGRAALRRVLVLVSADPRGDDRAAEGVRVAAGLRGSGRLDLALAFEGAGALCATAGAEGFADGVDMARNTASFAGAGNPLWVEAGEAPVSVTGSGVQSYPAGQRPWKESAFFAVLRF